jgi:Ser/Thr protein kinase RdoA (MazF antagonist)
MSLMRLSTFWAVHGTLSAAEEPGPLARQIAARWEHDPGTLRLFRSSANSVYHFETGGQGRFLRFAADWERSRRLIEAEVELLQWLLARGLDVAAPVPSAAGHLVETVEADAGSFHAVVFEALAGRQLEIGDLDRDHFRAWGAALGRLHATTSQCPESVLQRRLSWRDDLAQVNSFIPAHETAVGRELDDLVRAIEGFPSGREYCGLIHGDFELDNLRWAEDGSAGGHNVGMDRGRGASGASDALGTPAMLDFDDCATHWYAADIAFALRAVFDSGAGRDDGRVGAFVGGYRSYHPLDDEALATVPLFSRLARLRSYTTQIRALDLPDSAAQPDWLRGLRRKLEARTAAYAATLAR